MEWNSEMTRDIKNEFIAWRSLPGSDFDNEGSVSFTGDTSNLSEVDLFDADGNFLVYGIASGDVNLKTVTFVGFDTTQVAIVAPGFSAALASTPGARPPRHWWPAPMPRTWPGALQILESKSTVPSS